MSVEALRLWSEARLMSGMASAYPAVPIRFENASFHQPTTTWASFVVLDGKSFAANLGTKKVDRHVGLLQFDVMLAINTGTSQGNLIAQWAGNLFREKNVILSDGSTLITKTPQITSLGIQSGFYRIMCRLGYWRDEPMQ